MGRRLTATSRRANLCRGAILRRRGKVTDALLSVVQSIFASGTPFGTFANAFTHGRSLISASHCGDLLPIPAVDNQSLDQSTGPMGLYSSAVAVLTNFSLAGLNFLYGGSRAIAVPRHANAVQRSAQERQGSKWWGLIR